MVTKKHTAPDPSKMDQQRQQCRAHHDPCRARADGAKDAVDDRIERARVRDRAEVKDREHEHADDRREALDAVKDELQVCSPNPPISEAAIGTMMSATSGDMRFDRIAPSNTTMVASAK